MFIIVVSRIIIVGDDVVDVDVLDMFFVSNQLTDPYPRAFGAPTSIRVCRPGVATSVKQSNRRRQLSIAVDNSP